LKTATLPNLIEYLSADQSHQKGEFVVLVSGVDKNNKVDGEAQLSKILPILLTEMV
jgi:16S rRNA (cytidine1402-2'-O)-methyltransferase